MSRPPATGLRAARPAATSWFLLTLTALAAFLGSGLELGRLADPSARLVASATSEGPGGEAPAGQTDRRADARVPFVGAVLGSTPSPAGAPGELATSGSALPLGAPSGVVALLDDAPQSTSSAVVRPRRRSPPV